MANVTIQGKSTTNFQTGNPNVALTETINSTDKSLHTVNYSERLGVGISREILDLTTTIQTLNFASGLLSVELSYLDLGSAIGDWIFVVFDALSDADAATKLTIPESRIRIMLGESGTKEFIFSTNTPCYRLDMISNVASETGDSVVRVIGKTL